MFGVSESSNYNYKTGETEHNSVFNVTSPSGYGGSVNVSSTKSFTNQSMSSGSVNYDPMNDYLEFFSLFGTPNFDRYQCQMLIDRYQCKDKFWDASEIFDWLEANVKERVFIQKSMSSSWLIQFVNNDEKTKFWSWYNAQHKKNRFVVVCERENRESASQEIDRWCRNHCSMKYDVRPSYHASEIHVAIQSDDEAVQFKLTFSERLR